jgi:hypothetical protein
MKILNFFVQLFLIVYLLSTLIYNLPNNPIKIYNQNFYSFFNVFLQQRWDFFAPPPQVNNRLYYTFYDVNKKKLGMYEVLAPIMKEKHESLPFNTNSETIDYILSGSVNEVLSTIVNKNNQLRYLHKGKTTSEIYKISMNELLKDIEKNSNFKTMINFSKLINSKNIKNPKDTKYLKIMITEEKTKKFIDRYKKDKTESLLLETNYIDYGNYN